MTESPGQPVDFGSASDLVAYCNANPGALNERMGLQITEVTAERVVGTMPVAGNTQPYGLLHGGASCVLAESLGSIAAAVHAGSGRVAVGLDINATHHRGVSSGHVHGVATPLKLGRTVAMFEIVVSDDEGRRVCTSRLTCSLRDVVPGSATA